MENERTNIKDFNDIVNLLVESLGSLLNDKEREIITLRYIARKKKTLEEISKLYGVTRERIRQIESKSLSILAKFLMEIGIEKIDQLLVDKIENEVFSKKNFATFKSIMDAFKLSENKADLLCLDLIHKNDFHEFLNANFIYSEIHGGWFLSEPTQSCGTVSMSLDHAISKCKWPIKIAELSKFIGIPMDVIKENILLTSGFSLRVTGGTEYLEINKVKKKDGLRFILRKHGKELSAKEIQEEYKYLFNEELGIGLIRNTLGDMEDALIVDRGVYNLYENLHLTINEIQEVSQLVVYYLLERQIFVSSKIIINDLIKQNSDKKYLQTINAYILLGILQNDDRFDTRRGFMIGLHGKDFRGKFKDLDAEIIELMKKNNNSLSIYEIIQHLSDHRDLIFPSVKNQLDANENFVMISTSAYALKNADQDQNKPKVDITDEDIFDNWEINE